MLCRLGFNIRPDRQILFSFDSFRTYAEDNYGTSPGMFGSNAGIFSSFNAPSSFKNGLNRGFSGSFGVGYNSPSNGGFSSGYGGAFGGGYDPLGYGGFGSFGGRNNMMIPTQGNAKDLERSKIHYNFSGDVQKIVFLKQFYLTVLKKAKPIFVCTALSVF